MLGFGFVTPIIGETLMDTIPGGSIPIPPPAPLGLKPGTGPGAGLGVVPGAMSMLVDVDAPKLGVC